MDAPKSHKRHRHGTNRDESKRISFICTLTILIGTGLVLVAAAAGLFMYLNGNGDESDESSDRTGAMPGV